MIVMIKSPEGSVHCQYRNVVIVAKMCLPLIHKTKPTDALVLL